MKKIHQLQPHIIAKIAAGEVIERPAYAVKELIENAIDANANYITIQIEKAGLKKIVVTDNGEGMNKEDIAVCFQPHTTSKISKEEDLIGIRSLGFRGEALSSIVAISNVTIKSRSTEDPGGIMVQLTGGVVKKISPIGMPVGTSIIVEHIFSHIPARKKFLKSIRTEFHHILGIVTQYAVAFPHIRFFLSHDKRIILDLPQNQGEKERMQILLGKDIFQQLLPIEYEDSYVKISGFIAKPHITTHTNSKQFLFINRRKITDRAITLAIKESYGSLIDKSSYPVFVLFFFLPYEIIDVNVHPRKEQVSFINAEIISEHVIKAVTQALGKNSQIFHTTPSINNISLHDEYSPRFGNTESFAGKFLKETVIPWNIKDEVLAEDILQLNNTYLVTQTKKGLLLIDQHAAHERILFEQFSSEFMMHRRKKQIFHLKRTISFEMSLSETELLNEHMAAFSSLGFGIDNFSGTTFTVRSIPLLFKDRDIRILIHELLDDITEKKRAKHIDTQTHKMIAYLACKAAIKAGEKLTKEEAKKLIQELEKTQNNVTCPHGRPTKIEIHVNYLHRMFKRK